MTENTLQPIRVFHLQPGSGAQELAGLPQAPPAQGFYWIACTRAAFSAELPRLQADKPVAQAVTAGDPPF